MSPTQYLLTTSCIGRVTWFAWADDIGPDGTVWVLDGDGLRRSTDRGRTLETVPGW